MQLRADPAHIRPLLDVGMLVGVATIIISQIVGRITNEGQQLLPIWLVIPLALALLIAWRHVSSLPGTRPLGPLLFVLGCCLVVVAEGTGTSIIMLLLGVVNVIVVAGPRVGVLTQIAVLVAMLGTIPLWPTRSLADAVRQTIGLLPLFVFVLVVGWALRTAYDAVARNQRLVAELEQSSADLRELVLVEERNRAAQELHDGLGHQLTVVGMGLDLAERTRNSAPQDAWDEVARAKQVNATALADMRRWVRAMRPLSLRGVRGSAALAAVAESFRRTDQPVDLEVCGVERSLSDRAELTLQRVLQESLTNVVKHADATHVWLVLEFGEDDVVLTVTDNGRGSTVAEPLGAGFGLSSLTRRLTEQGGRLNVDNVSSGGFRLRARLVDRP